MVVEIVPEKQMLAISSVNWQNTFIFSICELLCVILKALLIMKLFQFVCIVFSLNRSGLYDVPDIAWIK